MRAFLLAFFGVGLTASAAQAFTAINDLEVNPLQQGFEVVVKDGAGPRQIWCAAAQYARRVQGNGPTTRIYITDGYGPSATSPGRRAVAFTTQSASVSNSVRPGEGGNYSVSIRKPGYTLTVAHAESFCSDVFEDRFDWPVK
ncbi:MAG: hypothetical protein OQK00_07745 [Rhodobacteraceae bacterium]|nr:hypothetical protein [Paracoccaceae bacterium]MCW9042231.1 hypothetical protein [Pseudopelagicola sp.]